LSVGEEGGNVAPLKTKISQHPVELSGEEGFATRLIGSGIGSVNVKYLLASEDSTR